MAKIIADWSSTDIMREAKAGGKYLIHCPRGLGDAVMFWRCFEALRERRPECTFDISLSPERMHPALFPGAIPAGAACPEPIRRAIPNPEKYDAVFVVGTKMETATASKAWMLCRHELGIAAPEQPWPEFAAMPSPFVAVHFWSGKPVDPTTKQPDEAFCRAIWNEICEAGLIPLDVEMPLRGEPQPVYEWMVQARQSVGKAAANAQNLLGMVQRCRAFVGVLSAPLALAAASKLPVMLIRNRLKIAMGAQGWPELDPRKPFPTGAVRDWLCGLTADAKAVPETPVIPKEIRLAGLMMIHENSPIGFEKLVIGELARHVDALFIAANKGRPESWAKAAKECPKLAGYKEIEVKQGSQPEGAAVLRLLDEAKPEIAAYIDSDEILPPNVEAIIAAMELAGKKCVRFPLLTCTGGAERVIDDQRLVGHGPHCKIFVWRPGLDRQGDAGFDFPADDYAQAVYDSPWPMRHLVVASAEAWVRRWRTKAAPWMTQAWPTAIYDPLRTWEQWNAKR